MQDNEKTAAQDWYMEAQEVLMANPAAPEMTLPKTSEKILASGDRIGLDLREVVRTQAELLREQAALLADQTRVIEQQKRALGS